VTDIVGFLILGDFLFAIGLYGLMTKRNLIRIIISLEIMLNAVNVMIAAVAAYMGAVEGVILVLFMIALGAVETAVGIGLIVALYYKFNTINLNEFTKRRW
jgi:NADH-quinone oxidoreductase subunit K